MYGQLIKGKKGVFFDLDGTIVNTEPLWAKAFEIVLNEVSPKVPTGIESMYNQAGVSEHLKWKKIKNEKYLQIKESVEVLVQKTEQEFLKILEKLDLYPTEGFWELAYYLKIKKQFKLALTTNTPEKVAREILNKLDIEETFDFYIFGDQVKNKKPDPEMYIKTAKHFNLKPEEILVFEDSISGSKAAVKAGIDTVIIGEGFYENEGYPKEIKKYFPDFRELPTNLDVTYKEAWEEYRKAVLKKYEKKGLV